MPQAIRPDGTYSWRCPISRLSPTGPSRPGEWLSPGAARLRRNMLDTGDTAWVLMSTALVMLMTPALGFFYGGLVQRKNVLSTIMHSFFILALISVQWVLWGYSLAFAPGGSLFGGIDWLALRGVGQEPNPDYAGTIPALSFMAFQMMFAIITPALISGAFAERKRFKAMAIFSLLWATLVYAPVAHWVWGVGGWLRTYGALGAGLLWFGWFGFNGGSALGANGLAANALVVTNTAAAMGGLAWMTASWFRHGHPSVLGLAAGAVAGLVAITPAAGFVNTPASILIGLGAGVFCFFAVDILKRNVGVDDALDVFAVHGVGGIWGALATGLFATTSVNAAGADGLFYGNPGQLLKQAVAGAAVATFTAAVTWVILKVVDVTVGLRVPEQEEVLGLDTTTHGEVAYQL